MQKPFLEAEWRKLLMANYCVDPRVLEKYRPAGTQIDLFRGECYVSLVGFMFLNTRVLGMRVPFHVNFEEVNLRFYVRAGGSSGKRGVVFIKEIVPKYMLAIVANGLYRENYAAMPMKHSWAEAVDSLHVTYSWKKEKWNSIEVRTGLGGAVPLPDSEETFITEHYWGYSRAGVNKTIEYEVVHPQWSVYKTQDYHVSVDFGANYGDQFSTLSQQKPESVFLAEGSHISVLRAGKL